MFNVQKSPSTPPDPGVSLISLYIPQNITVVVILKDQLRELLLRVIEEGLAVRGAVDKGDFAPGDDAVLVEQVVGQGRVLLMGQADKGGADFLSQADVLALVVVGNGPTFVEAILVEIHAVQVIGPAVQVEAVVRIDRVKAGKPKGCSTWSTTTAAKETAIRSN